LGVSASMLHRWRERFEPELTGGSQPSQGEREEIERLRSELRDVKAENTLLKSRSPLREGSEVAVYALIHAERASIPVARACRVLEVSRSGYYQWLHAEPSERAIDDAVLAAEIKEVFHEHKGRYGAPRVRRALSRAEPDRARNGWLD
jgi:putative transposase